jgi:hypothetical protein
MLWASEWIPCVSEIMNLGVQYFSLVSLLFQYHTFTVWLFAVNQCETTWLVSHFTTVLLLSRSLSAPSSCIFIKWGWLVSCFIDWDAINHLICFVLPKSICVLLKITSIAFLAFSGYFVLLLVCHMFLLESNKHFILTMDCSICDSFIPPS